MKRDEERKQDWQEEVWRVKAELAAEAKRMGMREYVAFVEREADRILEARTNPSLFVARDRPPSKPQGVNKHPAMLPEPSPLTETR